MKYFLSFFILLFLCSCSSDEIYYGNNKRLRITRLGTTVGGKDSYSPGYDSGKVSISYLHDVVTGTKDRSVGGTSQMVQDDVYTKMKTRSKGIYYDDLVAKDTLMWNNVHIKENDRLLVFDFDKWDVDLRFLIFTVDGIYDEYGNKWTKE